MALKRVYIPSPNYSSRGGANVDLIVLHTAEGARTIESLGSFFQGDVGASSHTGADDKQNTIGEYVDRQNKAWTQANFNPQAVSIELCGFASWTEDEWHRHPNMLQNCAAWIAEEAHALRIPITRLSAAQAQAGERGVCQHVDLGSQGGGHWDCGSGFPIDYVLDLARGTTHTPTPEPIEEADMITAVVKKNGAIELFCEKEDGRIFHTWQKEENGKWYSQDGGKTIGWQNMGDPAK